jgi:60 kDa SS-A/Ro ribonucleoprotein
MQRFHKHFNTKETPQSEAIPGTDQVPNRAGGFVWELGPWDRLDRFLILGTEGGTFYATERTLTVEDATNVLALLEVDGPRVVERIVEISAGGKAYKNAPALFALALAFTHGDERTKKAAEAALPRVARIGTHLFGFLEYADAMRGWGRGLRRSVARWYGEMQVDRLAYQVTKYQQRGGWSHRDALRLAHPQSDDAARNDLYGYIVGGAESDRGRAAVESVPYLGGVERIKVVQTAREAADLIREYDLPREVVPTALLGEAVVWEALLEKMPMTAMIRNLATMTRVGLLKPMSEASAVMAGRLWALENRIEADAFVILTDSETWYGKIPSFPGAAEVPAENGHPREARRCRDGLEWLLHRRSERRRHARHCRHEQRHAKLHKQLRRRRAAPLGRTQGFHGSCEEGRRGACPCSSNGLHR